LYDCFDKSQVDFNSFCGYDLVFFLLEAYVLFNTEYFGVSWLPSLNVQREAGPGHISLSI